MQRFRSFVRSWCYHDELCFRRLFLTGRLQFSNPCRTAGGDSRASSPTHRSPKERASSFAPPALRPVLMGVVRQNEIVSSHEVKSPANLSRPVVVAAQWVNQHEIMARIRSSAGRHPYLILGTSLTYPSVQPAISPPMERTIRSSRSSLPLPFSSQATRRS